MLSAFAPESLQANGISDESQLNLSAVRPHQSALALAQKPWRPDDPTRDSAVKRSPQLKRHEM
jgi:hypothetical protein